MHKISQRLLIENNITRPFNLHFKLNPVKNHPAGIEVQIIGRKMQKRYTGHRIRNVLFCID